MPVDYKPMEPLTVVTDAVLAVSAIIFGSILFYCWIKQKDKQKPESLLWIGLFYSIALFACFGALSHASTSITTAHLFWPPTMIFGGLSFIFIVAGVIIYQKKTDYGRLLTIPAVLIILYLILAIKLNWMFPVWILLLLVCSGFIFYFSFKAGRQNKPLASCLTYGLIIILIGGGIQAVGGFLQWNVMIGADKKYLVQPHNDIFHMIGLVGMYVLYKGFKEEYR